MQFPFCGDDAANNWFTEPPYLDISPQRTHSQFSFPIYTYFLCEVPSLSLETPSHSFLPKAQRILLEYLLDGPIHRRQSA